LPVAPWHPRFNKDAGQRWLPTALRWWIAVSACPRKRKGTIIAFLSCVSCVSNVVTLFGAPCGSLSSSAIRVLLLGPYLSEFSYQIAAVAVAWQIYALTNRALALGLIGLKQFGGGRR
jgi:hypothetical protein